MASRPTLSREEKRSIIDKNPFCVYCGNNEYEGLVLEHIYPFSLGGSNRLNNITISCGKCNSHKHNYTISEFLEVTIRKRNNILNETYRHVYNLRSLRTGIRLHYQHNEHSIIKKIERARFYHSYYTRIISAINKNKYQIFN